MKAAAMKWFGSSALASEALAFVARCVVHSLAAMPRAMKVMKTAMKKAPPMKAAAMKAMKKAAPAGAWGKAMAAGLKKFPKSQAEAVKFAKRAYNKARRSKKWA